MVIWALWDWCYCLCCIFRILILHHFSPSQLLPSSVWVHHLYFPVHFVQCPFFPRLLWSSTPTTVLGTNSGSDSWLSHSNLPAFQLNTWFTGFSKIYFLCPSASTVILIFLFSLKPGAHYSNHSHTFPQLTWYFLLPSRHLTRLWASTSSVSTFCRIYPCSEQPCSHTTVIHSIPLDLLVCSYLKAQYCLWIWFCWRFYLLAMDLFISSCFSVSHNFDCHSLKVQNYRDWGKCYLNSDQACIFSVRPLVWGGLFTLICRQAGFAFCF